MNWIKRIQRWFLLLPFVQQAFIEERDEQIAKERSKWFVLAQRDFQETMQDDLDKQANELAEKKLEALLSVINKDDVIAQNGSKLYLGGKLADSQRISNLKAEADFFMASDLWKVLNETPKELAQQALFKDDGKSEILHAKGRAMLFLLDTQKKIIDTLQQLSTPPTP